MNIYHQQLVRKPEKVLKGTKPVSTFLMKSSFVRFLEEAVRKARTNRTNRHAKCLTVAFFLPPSCKVLKR